MLKNPKVTIAIPTFNRKEFLKNAIHSALEVDYSNKEIIVSDNGSTDGTTLYLDRLSNKSIKIYKSKENKGVIWNWNNCLNHANGDAIIFLSDDDILEKKSIVNLLSTLNEIESDKRENIKFIFGDVEVISDKKEHINNIAWSDKRLMNALDFKIEVLRAGFSPLPSSVLFSTRDALEAGGFRERYKAGIDMGLMFEILNKDGLVMHINKIVTKYNKHDSSFTRALHPDDVFFTFQNLANNTFKYFKGTKSELKKLKHIKSKALIRSRTYSSIQFFKDGKFGFIQSFISIIKGFRYINSFKSLFFLLKAILKLILISLNYLIKSKVFFNSKLK